MTDFVYSPLSILLYLFSFIYSLLSILLYLFSFSPIFFGLYLLAL